MEELVRDYHLSDSELAMFTSNLIVFMNRDVVEFTAKGVDETAINALETLGDAFEVLPNDAYYRADIMLAVDNKNEHRESLENRIRAIVGCAKIKWGNSSPYVKRFDVGKMTQDNDKKFLTIARQTVVVATSYLDDLSDKGLTQEMIDSLNDEAQSMEDEMNNIAEKEAERDIKTQERIEKGNEIYGFVANYCEVGKIIWYDVDPAKYNDYVIYPTGSGGGTPSNPPIAPELNYSSNEFSWDAVPTSTSYQLVYHAVGETEWIELYDGEMPEAPIPFNPDNGEYVARLRARNAAGFGEWSDERTVTVGLQPPQIWELVYNSSTNLVTLQWNNSIGATDNDIYQSIVPIGDPAGSFTLIESISGQVFQHEVTSYDVTEYYYIIARNATESSDPTETFSVDVPV